MMSIRGYVDRNGNQRFANWFEGLDASAAAKVTLALTRIEQGNFSNAKSVGGGVYEFKIDFGPGYRITSAKTAIGLSFSSAAARRNGSKGISRRRRNAGLIINEERSGRPDNAPYS